MNTEEYQQTEQEIVLEQKRGSFLSILCILTFVGAGLEIFSSFYSFITFDSYLKSLQNSYGFLSASAPDAISLTMRDTLAKEIEVITSWGKIGFIGKIVAAFICLIGALLMWNLKKKGFKIYVVGQIAFLLVTFVILKGVGGLFANYYFAWIIIPTVFVGLYATNLKKMN